MWIQNSFIFGKAKLYKKRTRTHEKRKIHVTVEVNGGEAEYESIRKFVREAALRYNRPPNNKMSYEIILYTAEERHPISEHIVQTFSLRK